MTHQQQVAERLAQLRREKSARERRDVLQSEIAEAAGISAVTYGRYENGRRKIPDEVLIALAKFYGVTPGYIRYGEPDRGATALPVEPDPSLDRKLSERERASLARVAEKALAKRAKPKGRHNHG